MGKPFAWALLGLGVAMAHGGCGSSGDELISCAEDCCADVQDQDVCELRVDDCSRDNDEQAEANCLKAVPFNPGCIQTGCLPIAN